MTNEKYFAQEVYKLFGEQYATAIESGLEDEKKFYNKFEINFALDFAFVVVYDMEQEKFSILRNEFDIMKKYKYEAEYGYKSTMRDIDIDLEVFFDELDKEFNEKFEGHEKYTNLWKNIVREQKERAIWLQPRIKE